MTNILLVIHLLIAIALVSLVLMQKSEGGGLGIGGGGGGSGGGFLTGRGTANLLTRTTAILAVAFFSTSMLLAITAGRTGSDGGSVFDRAPVQQNGTAPGQTNGGGVLDDLEGGRGLAPLPSLPSDN